MRSEYLPVDLSRNTVTVVLQKLLLAEVVLTGNSAESTGAKRISAKRKRRHEKAQAFMSALFFPLSEPGKCQVFLSRENIRLFLLFFCQEPDETVQLLFFREPGKVECISHCDGQHIRKTLLQNYMVRVFTVNVLPAVYIAAAVPQAN